MKKEYRWLLVFAGALAFTLSNAFSIAQDERFGWPGKAVQLLAVTLSIFGHFYCLYAIAILAQKRYPGLSRTRARIGRTIACGVPVVSVLMGLTDAWQEMLRGEPAHLSEWHAWLATLFQGAAIAIYIIGISEAIYQYDQLVQAEREKEELQRLNLMAQYDSLKQQINPHFLFNSLNSLSSLIAIDPGRAEQFVEELSSVYRYLLQSSRDELATLGAELGFLHSYLHLLKTRFGDSLRAEIAVPEHWHQHRIPPLTLQVLVENAVKHNEVSAAHPLHLSIRVGENGYLTVSNNLQPKVLNIPSEKVGLANIMAKYRLLRQPEVLVHADQQAFAVSLPLIQPA